MCWCAEFYTIKSVDDIDSKKVNECGKKLGHLNFSEIDHTL